MKRIFVIILIAIFFVTGCTAGDNHREASPTKEDSIIENQDELDNGDTSTGAGDKTAASELAIGLEAPDFTLINLDGEEVSLSDFREKIVLINFWASWCQYCHMEMPDLNMLHNNNDDVVILAVNVEESEETVRKYIEENQLDFEVVLDRDGAISRQYLTSGLPNSYFVDPEGIFLGRFPGMMTAEQMDGVINNIRDLAE